MRCILDGSLVNLFEGKKVLLCDSGISHCFRNGFADGRMVQFVTNPSRGSRFLKFIDLHNRVCFSEERAILRIDERSSAVISLYLCTMQFYKAYMTLLRKVSVSHVLLLIQGNRLSARAK